MAHWPHSRCATAVRGRRSSGRPGDHLIVRPLPRSLRSAPAFRLGAPSLLLPLLLAACGAPAPAAALVAPAPTVAAPAPTTAPAVPSADLVPGAAANVLRSAYEAS